MLYNQATLVERALRRTAPPPAALSAGATPASATAAAGPQPVGLTTSGRAKQAGPPDASAGAGGVPSPSQAAPVPSLRAQQPRAPYAMDEHMEWVIPCTAATLRCLNGLAAADAAGLLGPLQVRRRCAALRHD
jgi:hypothetical protein